MAKEDRGTYIIKKDGLGQVQIAEEVVAIIAGLAATEVEGVATMAGNITNDIVGRLGKKSLSRGVEIELVDGVVKVDLALILEFEAVILDVSKKVQEKVKSSIENMTGLEVSDINIRIAGVGASKNTK